MTDDPIALIAAWLEGERALIWEHAQALKIGRRVSVTTMQIELVPIVGVFGTPASAYMASELPQLVNPLLDPKTRYALEHMFPHDPTNEALSLATMLYKRFGDRCRAWQQTLDLAADRETKIARAFLMPARQQYLYGLVGLDQPDPARAYDLARSTVELIKAEHITVVQFVPVGGIALSGAVEAAGISVRPLTPQQLSALHTRPDFERETPIMPEIRMQSSRFFSERVGIYVRQKHPKTERPPADYRLQRVILALQLLGFDPCGLGQTSRWTEPGPALYRDGASVRVREGSAETGKELTREVLENVADLSDRIPVETFSSGSKPGSLPLSRFLTAVTEYVPADAILDYAIALEAVLLPGISDEVSFRFSLHGALLLEDTLAARKDVQKQFKTIYGARCKLAHGEEGGTSQKYIGLAPEARELCSRALLKGLRDGWPTREFFDNLVLGGKPL